MTSRSILLFGLALTVSCTPEPPGLRPHHPMADDTPLACALLEYEQALLKLATTGAYDQRAAAVQALADIGSPLFPEARDALVNEREVSVQVALLQAILAMGDTSEQALRVAERGLLSHELTVVQGALRVFQHFNLPIRFTPLWHADRPPSLCLWLGSRFIERLDGVGAVRPWRDPAWRFVPYVDQNRLLARAGTEEALQLLSETLSSETEQSRRQVSWVRAEPVDPAALRALLADPNLELRIYAAYSLVAAGVHDHLAALLHDPEERLRTLAARALFEAGDPKIKAKVERAIREQGLTSLNTPVGPLSSLSNRDLPLLATDTVRHRLLQVSELTASLHEAAREELERRGQPLTWGQLLGREPVLGSRHLVTGPTATHTQLSLVCRAVIQQRAVEVLPIVVDNALAAGLPDSVPRTLWGSPQLLLALPEDIARTCVQSLDTWAADRLSKTGANHNDRVRTAEAYKLLGMLARDSDAERIWQQFRAAEDPLAEHRTFLSVAWGVNRRSEELRELVAPVAGYPAVRGELPYPVVPRPLRWTGGHAWDACGPAREVAAGVISRPRASGAVTEAWQRLASKLERTYSAGEEQRLRADLLALREVPLLDRDRLHEDRRTLARDQTDLLKQAVGKGPLRTDPTLDLPGVQLTAEDLAWVTQPLALPGPDLSAEDRAWVLHLIAEARRQEVERLVHEMTTLEELRILGYFNGEPARLRVKPPSAALLRPDLSNEIRPLLADPRLRVRHAAAWALWRMLGDPEATALLMHDAQGTDPAARTAALNALLAGRHPTVKGLLPPLLTESDPVLRGLGLALAGLFGIREAIPEVMVLLDDDDLGVADAAMHTLVALDERLACPHLMRLASSDDRLARFAPSALKKCRDPKFVDELLERLSATTASGDHERSTRLVGAISEMTWGLLGPVGRPLVARPPPSVETVAAWREWWSNRQTQPPAAWVKHALEDRVAMALISTHSLAEPACRRLSIFFKLNCRRDAPEHLLEPQLSTLQGMLASMELWEVLASPLANNHLDLDLLMAVDPARTRRFLVDGGRGGPNAHADLVRYAGVDLGDPGAAACGYREQVVAAWRKWAQAHGWMR